MNNIAMLTVALVGFFIAIFVAIKIGEKLRQKDEQKRIEELEREFELYFCVKPAKEKLLKDFQIKTIVKPKLKRFAQDFDAVCKNEASLQHQMKYEPEKVIVPYDAVVTNLKDVKNNVQGQKTFFYSALQVAIDLKFVPEKTNFKKCLNLQATEIWGCRRQLYFFIYCNPATSLTSYFKLNNLPILHHIVSSF
jgi:hypothetical protein